VDALAAPVQTTAGLVLLAVLGVGALTAVVDLVAVGLQRPAAAGLPLLLLFAVPSGTVAGGVGWWPFALGAAGWLGLLLVEGGQRVTRWGSPASPSAAAVPVVRRPGRAPRRAAHRRRRARRGRRRPGPRARARRSAVRRRER
jgi:hypothetical protein